MNEDFLKDAYQIIASNDELKYLILKEELNKLTQSLYKISVQEYLVSSLLKLYYLLINNPVYTEVTKQSLNTLKTEIQVLSYLNNYFKDQNKEYNAVNLTIILDLVHLVNEINDIRVSYIKENTNIGRTLLSTYQLKEIEALSENIQELKKALK